MGRLPRAIDDGLVYHASNRGNNGANVFTANRDREGFLESIGQSQDRYPFRLFGYCLMRNHFHLLLQPEPGQSISRILQSITVAHTWRYHRHHRSSGHVWQGRFKSSAIQDDEHMLIILRYIEANPVRARLVGDAGDYLWSSFQCHGLGQADALLSSFPQWERSGPTEAERRRRWRAKVRRAQGEDELKTIRDSLLSGRPFGQAEWVVQIAERLGIDPHPRPRGRPPKARSADAT